MKMNAKLQTSLSKDVCEEEELLNPFVHHLELETTYDKIKIGLLTVLLLPLRVMVICVLVIAGWLLACVGLWGLTEEELRQKPLDGWRSQMKSMTASVVRCMYASGGVHLRVIGRQAERAEAPVIALAPHSSFMDSVAMVYLDGPSIVAKGETASIPFFGSMFALLIPLICLLGKSTYMVGGMRLVIKGRQASREEAPILVMAPHSSFLDGGIVYATGFPTIIVRRESGTNPYIGKLINFTQPVYVWRDDPESRQRTIREIVMRATSPEPWPQVLIFPEGTCTNRSCLITFKPGAFYPGVPVQPVCIRYPNKLDTVTWTWEGPSALKLLWYTLTQPYSYCEIEFLPVYTPNEEEKKDPKLFANNVRAVMAKALGVPVVDYTYDDCKLMTKAKEMHLPNASSLFEVQKLRHKLGLQNASAEESLINSNLLCKDCNQITYTEFVNLLHLPLNEPSTHQLFRLYDKNNTGMIDFREYLLGVLAVSGNKTNLEIVKIAFKIYDSSGCGKLTVEDFISALTQTLAITREYALILFNQLDTSHLDYVTLDGFLMFAEKKAEFSSLFELKEKKSSSDSYENCPAYLTKKID